MDRRVGEQRAARVSVGFRRLAPPQEEDRRLKTSIKSPSRRILAAVACVTAAGVLTACDADTAGAAAVVGGDAISIRELQDQVRDVTVSSPEGGEPTGDQTEVQQTLLERMIQHELLAAVGHDEGIEVTDNDRGECRETLFTASRRGRGRVYRGLVRQ